MEKVKSSLVSATGLGLSHIMMQISAINPSDVKTTLDILVQIALGVATIWGFFKKKRSIHNQK